MPVEVGLFEEEVKLLSNNVDDEQHGYFDYNGKKSFKKVTKEHFGSVQGLRKYGVYIVRYQESNEVIYIGKGGSIDQHGNFGKQDLPKRLINTRTRNKSADDTFLEYYNDGGPLRIEYFILPDKKLCPGMMEAFLLQAYLKAHNHLPKKNKKL